MQATFIRKITLGLLGGSLALASFGAFSSVASAATVNLCISAPSGKATVVSSASQCTGSGNTFVAVATGVGPQGPAGPVGPQGIQGIPGPIGPQGDVGPQGPIGLKGDKGDTGATGPSGAAGSTGAQGTQGPKGDTGSTGPTGPAGADGAAGATGPAGPQGIQGTIGPAGADGTSVKILGTYASLELLQIDHPACTPGDGYLINGDLYVCSNGTNFVNVGHIQGPQGDTGATGPQGPTGPAGAAGADGAAGATGATGPAGAKGDTGSQGPTGPQGDVGPKGDKGDPGTNGINGGAGSIGPAGPQGDKGDTGAQGPIGPAGPTGATGPAGPQGEVGPTGPAGADSTVPGPQGPAGPAGSDATVDLIKLRDLVSGDFHALGGDETDPVFTLSAANNITVTQITNWDNTVTGLSTEITDRTTADNGLQGDISTEATTRAGADTTLTNNLATEVTDRTSADTTLQTNINSKENSIPLGLSSQYLAGDKSWQTFPTALSQFTNDLAFLTTFTEADPFFVASPAHGIAASDIIAWNGAVSGLASETTARIAADGTLQTNIDSETSARTTADTTLGAADTTLQSNIDTEATARTSADTTLQNNIDALFGTKNTDNLSEGATNKYFTGSGFNAAFSAKTTTDLSEGTNLYFTDARAKAAIDAAYPNLDTDNTNDFDGDYSHLTNKPTIPTVPTVLSAFTNDAGFLTTFTEADPFFIASPAHGITGTQISNWDNTVTGLATEITNRTSADTTLQTTISAEATTRAANDTTLQTNINGLFGTKTTTDLTEGTNKYYTDARARAAISGTVPISYNSSTGAIGLNQTITRVTGTGVSGGSNQNPGITFGPATASCTGGTKLVGGGAEITGGSSGGANAAIFSSSPSSTIVNGTWTSNAVWVSKAPSTLTLTSYALCSN